MANYGTNTKAVRIFAGMAMQDFAAIVYNVLSNRKAPLLFEGAGRNLSTEME